MKTVFVIKYALTDCIKQCEVTNRSDRYTWVKWSDSIGGTLLLTPKEWAEDHATALKLVEGMRARKIESLHKQIKRYENFNVKTKYL